MYYYGKLKISYSLNFLKISKAVNLKFQLRTANPGNEDTGFADDLVSDWLILRTHAG